MFAAAMAVAMMFPCADLPYVDDFEHKNDHLDEREWSRCDLENHQTRYPFAAIGAPGNSRGVHDRRAQRTPTPQLW
jgi:hypothetical protein